MKKFFVLLCVLVLVTGFAVAQIGVSVGADATVYNINKADDGDANEWNPVFMPWIEYDGYFLDDAMEFYTYLDYNFDFYPNFDDLSQYLNFELALTYDLGLGSASTLTLEADNTFESVAVSPEEFGSYVEATLTPRVRFTQSMDIGDIYVQAAAPLGYLDNDYKWLRSRLGWTSTFGLGLWAQLDSILDPMEIYAGWRVYVSYGADAFSFNVQTRGWKDTDAGLEIRPNLRIPFGDAAFRVGAVLSGVMTDGMSVDLTPGLDYSLGDFAFKVECEFADVTGKMSISPTVGVSFSF